MWKLSAQSGLQNPGSSLSYSPLKKIVENDERKQTEDVYRRTESQGGLAAAKGIKTINEIAQGYGVHPTQVNQWKKELLDNAGSLFEGKRGPKLLV
jgi:hypothetical protein